MQRLSAKNMRFVRWGPIVIVGLIITGFWIGEFTRPVPNYIAMLAVTLLAALALAYTVHRRHLWHLADEVLDGGDHLLVRFRKTTDRIEISNISNMEALSEFNATTIVLHLTAPSKFGSRLYFLADAKGQRWKQSPVVAELATRVQNRLGRVV